MPTHGHHHAIQKRILVAAVTALAGVQLVQLGMHAQHGLEARIRRFGSRSVLGTALLDVVERRGEERREAVAVRGRHKGDVLGERGGSEVRV